MFVKGENEKQKAGRKEARKRQRRKRVRERKEGTVGYEMHGRQAIKELTNPTKKQGLRMGMTAKGTGSEVKAY